MAARRSTGPGKILMTGGGARSATRRDRGGPPRRSTSHQAARPAWQTIAPMNIGRYNHNLTLLPDGMVMAIGGSPIVEPGHQHRRSTDGSLGPSTNVWSLMASVHLIHGYTTRQPRSCLMAG